MYLEDIIRDSVYSLDTYRYVDSYGPYGPGGYGPGYGYPIVDNIDTNGYGNVTANHK